MSNFFGKSHLIKLPSVVRFPVNNKIQEEFDRIRKEKNLVVVPLLKGRKVVNAG